MKKILIIFTAIFLLTLSGCSSNSFESKLVDKAWMSSSTNRGIYFNKDGTVEFLNANKESVKTATYKITDVSSDGNSATIELDEDGTITNSTLTFTANNELKVVEDGQSLILHTD